MSPTRGTTSCSSWRRARRSALERTSSMVLMGRRWETPLRLSTFLSSRGEEAIVHGELGAEVLVAAGGLDGVDVAYEVGYGDVGGGEFFDETVVGGQPRYWRVFAEASDEVAGELGDGSVGVVSGLGAGYVGR